LELISSRQQTVLLELLAATQPELTRYEGVHYLDIGYKYIGNTITSQLAVRIHVHQKQAPNRLHSSQFIPRQICGLSTDVIQSNRCLEATIIPGDLRFNPLIGGIAIRNPRHKVLGTLGAIVRDLTTRTYVGLSNYHVLVGNTGASGDWVTQPATADINDIIGLVNRWDQPLDCALCTLNSSRRLSREILDIPVAPTGITEPLLGMKVTKSGRTTGKTYGVIEGVSVDEFTVIPLKEFWRPEEEISAPGDSGAIWLNIADNQAVGLHYAGEKDPAPQNERAWAKKMTRVATVLKIAF
jgi:hypothetical protein